MNRNITRGLALAALTGGFTILGATAANAIDLPDLGGGDDSSLLGNGGLLGTGIGAGDGGLLDDLHLPVVVDAPVSVDGLNVSVLDGQNGVGSLGNGILATTGSTNAAILSGLGIDTTGFLGDDLSAIVGVPLDASNTWVSVLGNEPNGIAVVPTLTGGVFADVTDGVDGLLGVDVDVPVDVSCSSVTVLSDYADDCSPAPAPGDGGSSGGILDGGLLDGGIFDGGLLDGGILDGGLLDGGILDGGILDGGLLGDLIVGGSILDGIIDLGGDGSTTELPVTLDDETISILDGGTLGGVGDGLLGGDGILIDPADSVTEVGLDTDPTDPALGDVASAVVDAPVDLTETWVSVLGENGGIVIVPDLGIDTSVLTGGLITQQILAPISLDCITITVLSDFERDCAAGPTDPTDPTDPEEPTTPVVPSVPGGENGAVDNGGTDDAEGITDPCAVEPTAEVTPLSAPMDLGALAVAALVGALAAMGLLLIGRRLGQQ